MQRKVDNEYNSLNEYYQIVQQSTELYNYISILDLDKVAQDRQFFDSIEDTTCQEQNRGFTINQMYAITGFPENCI
jgi:hypothetical protein